MANKEKLEKYIYYLANSHLDSMVKHEPPVTILCWFPSYEIIENKRHFFKEKYYLLQYDYLPKNEFNSVQIIIKIKKISLQHNTNMSILFFPLRIDRELLRMNKLRNKQIQNQIRKKYSSIKI